MSPIFVTTGEPGAPFADVNERPNFVSASFILSHSVNFDHGPTKMWKLHCAGSAMTVIGVFAWMGATQIPYGLAQLAVATHYRSLVPLFLALALVERTLAAVAGWITKGAAATHHPPEHYAVVVLAPLIVVFLALSLRRRA